MEEFNYDRVRSLIRRYISDVTAIVYNNFVHQMPKMKVLALLNRELAALERDLGGLDPATKAFLRIQMHNIYYLVSKNSLVELRKVGKGVNYQEFIEKRSKVVFDAIESKLMESGMLTKAMNEAIRMHEFSIKEKKLAKLMGPSENYTPFVVCDVHDDCAKDHEAYQGKVYYKDGWDKYVEDPEVRARIKAYIRNHRCMSVNEVTRSKPYLIRRPYCRHELHEVSIDEVLSSSIKKILVSHNWIKSNFKNKSSVDRAWRSYLDQLEIYRDLWKVAPNPNLGKEMNRVRKLYKKWLNLKRG